MMRSNQTALLIAVLMFAAGIGAVVARPETTAAKLRPEGSLEAIVPKQFTGWREEHQGIVQVVNPQAQQLINTLYDQTLARTYVNADGYRIMLALAYGSDQRRSLRAHSPDQCYPGQGFTVQITENSVLATPFGNIPVRRLFATRGPRKEPVTYWFTVGDTAIRGDLQRKLVELSYTLTGRIPDGLLFRVSSIDADQDRANQLQDQFIKQLLQAVPAADRKYLSGLGDS